MKKRIPDDIDPGVGRTSLASAVLTMLVMTVIAAAGHAAPNDAPGALIGKALATVRAFADDPQSGRLRQAAPRAVAALVVPELIESAPTLGGSSGRGVLMVKHPATGRWNGPFFCLLESVGFQLMVGANRSQVLVLAMTAAGLDALRHPPVVLGESVSVATGMPRAALEGLGGIEVDLEADFVSFVRSRGVFDPVKLDGAQIRFDRATNRAFHGRNTDVTAPVEPRTGGGGRLREAIRELTAAAGAP